MPSFQTRDGIMERVQKFLVLCQDMCDAYMEANFPTLPKYDLVIAGGKKFLNIQKDEIGGSAIRPERRHSAYCFIDLTNGDILKPASYKKPAAHARGNIFADDFGLSCMGPYGPAYLNHDRTLQEPYCKRQVPNFEQSSDKVQSEA